MDAENKGALERRGGPVTLVADPASIRSGPPSAFDMVSSGLPLRDYLRIFRKNRWLIVTVIVVMVATVSIVTFRTQPVFESATRLEISGETPNFTELREMFLMMPTDEEFLQTQVRILQSDDLAMQTVRSLRLHERPEFSVRAASSGDDAPFTPIEEVQLIGRFRGGLSVQLIRSSRLVEVKFESTDAKLAADVANALADNYIETNFRKKYESTLQAQQWMAGQLREQKEKMEKSHEALVTYERNNQIYALSEGQNVTITKLAQVNQELTTAESERIAKESLYHLLKSGRFEEISAIAENPIIQDLEKRFIALQDNLVENRTNFGPNHPKVVQIDRQLNEVKSQLDRMRRQVASQIESEYQTALKREQLLRQALDAQKAEANVMNAKLVEYNVLKREYETNQQLYEGLLQRLKEAGISSGLRSNNVHVIDRARQPLSPIRPRKSLNIMLSLVVGIVVGGVLALFNEYLDNSVKMPDEVEQLVNLPALGVIPAVASVSANPSYGRKLLSTPKSQAEAQKVALASELPTVASPHSVVSEAYRALRTSILLSTSKQPPQTILITSGQPREGKTTTALNLAITLAQRGDRVVLIDSDLRRPRVHRAFQISNKTGLSSYLAGVITIDELPQPVPTIPNLFVITAGPMPPNPAEMLSSEPVVGLFAELRRQFDFILMDSPPAITVADSMILAAHADGVMIVVHGGVTTRESLKHVVKLMRGVSARILGVVLNNVDIRSADYQYYYTYYYGDYYRHMLEGYGYGYAPEEKEKKAVGAKGA